MFIWDEEWKAPYNVPFYYVPPLDHIKNNLPQKEMPPLKLFFPPPAFHTAFLSSLPMTEQYDILININVNQQTEYVSDHDGKHRCSKSHL